MTKIDIISGFLGAGKTTLIKKLIEEVLGDEKLVIIENEFGEIGIDGGFLQSAGIEIREMNSGCICCSLVGDFSLALKRVLHEYHPNRIIIEPSGVGKLSDVIQAVKRVQEQEATIEMNAVVSVIDAAKCILYMKNFGEFFNNQIAYAHTIVLSRTQKSDQKKLDEVLQSIKKVNGEAHIITTPWDKLGGDTILEAMEGREDLLANLMKDIKEEVAHTHHHHTHEKEHSHHAHDHHADEVFQSWGCETIHCYTREELKQILLALNEEDTYGVVLRAKGMLKGKDEDWLYFDFVRHEYEIRHGQPTYTGRFCIIGQQLKKEALQTLFKVA